MRYVIDNEIQGVVSKLEVDIKAKTKIFTEISDDVMGWIETLIKKYNSKGEKDVVHDIQSLQKKLLDCLEKANDLFLHYSWHMYLSRPPRPYKALDVKEETYKLIKQFIAKHPEAGYTSVAEVVQEALGRKFEEFKLKKQRDVFEGP